MKISFIATVLNEADNINIFLRSIVNQTRKADEIIITDGGSIDATTSIISNSCLPTGKVKFQISNKSKKKIPKIKLIIKKGNRSVGRNEAIKNSTGEIIVCSDAGCILDKNWIRSITEPFKDSSVDIVAGYYQGKARNSFEKSIIPYFLVMDGRVDDDNFLPATRSLAFRKSIWEKVGGFPEQFSNNEDYVFARNVKKNKAKMVFKKDAIVYWLPKKTLREAFVAFYRFSLGDVESGILRPKVIFLLLRYFLSFLLFVSFLITRSTFFLNILLILVVIYIIWSIVKNYKYVNEWEAFFYLPLIQITSDIMVIIGTIAGTFNYIEKTINHEL